MVRILQQKWSTDAPVRPEHKRRKELGKEKRKGGCVIQGSPSKTDSLYFIPFSVFSEESAGKS